MKKTKSMQYGISKAGALLAVFVGLKLAGQLDWSWSWVLSPYWIASAFAVTVSLWQLFRPSRRLRVRVHKRRRTNWSCNLGPSDGLFLLFFVLKWTGHISWSWFWVLFPLWICKPIGFLVPKDVSSKRIRRYKKIAGELFLATVVLMGVVLVALRLDGHIPSWWWAVAVFVFYCCLVPLFNRRLEAALSGRLRREKEERDVRRGKDGARAKRPTRSEHERLDPGRS